MTKYKTVAGDTFDLICYKLFGSCKYTEELINANRDKVETWYFKANETLNVPEIDMTKATKLPPWRR